ncbi:hypothetical protein EASAB2608_00320 [Streptomyces sp. EAS-AB2608]|nr:hypothetical protein EASAB2608_00320 [Streptomyces sp. EAS-AB2608]
MKPSRIVAGGFSPSRPLWAGCRAQVPAGVLKGRLRRSVTEADESIERARPTAYSIPVRCISVECAAPPAPSPWLSGVAVAHRPVERRARTGRARPGAEAALVLVRQGRPWSDWPTVTRSHALGVLRQNGAHYECARLDVQERLAREPGREPAP